MRTKRYVSDANCCVVKMPPLSPSIESNPISQKLVQKLQKLVKNMQVCLQIVKYEQQQ